MFRLDIPLVLSLLVASTARAQTYSATYTPGDAPQQSEEGQAGTNQCGSGYNQTGECQNAYINSVDDFCLFAPPEPGASSDIGDTERIEVAWCMKSGYGARLIPDGAITGAHFVQTPDYVQITGVGDLTKINIPNGDEGGELDPHGADGNGNPIGGLVFSSAFSGNGSYDQMHEWTNYVSYDEFCFRACKDGPNAPALCQHIYDELGCDWNMPANYSEGVFENCQGDSGEPMGVYGSSTFYQGEPSTPSAHSAPSSSSCSALSTISNGLVVSGTSNSVVSTPTGSAASATLTGSAASGSGGSGSSGGSSTSGSDSSSAGYSNVYLGWEKVVLTAGVAVIGSMLGAVVVL